MLIPNLVMNFLFLVITCNDTYNKQGLIAKYYGVNVDLYPIDGLPESDNEINDFFNKYTSLLKPRLFFDKSKK
jgi:hypothetical protein